MKAIAKPLSFNQKLAMFLGATVLLMILTIALIVFLSKRTSTGKIFTEFYKDMAERRIEQDERAKLAEAESMIKKDPKHAEGYAKRAECYESQNQSELALKDYNQAISLNPTKAEWYHARGQTRESEDFEKIIQDYSKAIELRPDKEYYFDRADTYADNDKWEKAILDLDEALRLGYPAAIVQERRGEVFSKSQKLDKAIDAFKQSIASRSDEELNGNTWETQYSQTKAHRELANVYTALNDFDSALKQVDAWIEKDPSDDEGYFVRARYYAALGDTEKSKADQNAVIECLTKRIDSYPSGFLYKYRAQAYKRMGKIEEAKSDFRKAIECYRKEIEDGGLAKDYYKSEIDNFREELGEKLDKPDYEKQIQEFSKKIAAKPNHANLYSERGALYLTTGQPTLALQDYETGRKLAPKDAGIGLQIARILIKQKKYDEAVSEYADLTKGEEAGNSWAYTKMAQAQQLSGKYDDAIKSADKAISLDPLTGDAYYWRSKAFQGNGEMEKAKASMVQARALDFDEKDFE
jgi:Tetratricopeptide repeat.